MPELFLGRYEIMRPLASGGMGAVSLARDLETNALVVVKTALDGDPSTLFDEARVVAQLQHPNIAAVLDAGQSQGKPFAVFELVDGASLSQLVKHLPDRRLPVEHAAYVVHEVLLALAYAHAAVDDAGASLGIVHRDVSPQNIMITRATGAVKLIDFGIARASVRESSATSTGIIKGKLRYLAPEQARALKLDGRCDQFAAGVVLWELLTGLPRLTERDELAALMHATDVPLERASMHRAIPRSLDDALARMTALDPGERFATCGDAAKAIAATLGGQQNAIAAELALMVQKRAEPAHVDERIDLHRPASATVVVAAPAVSKSGAPLRLIAQLAALLGVLAIAFAFVMFPRAGDPQAASTPTTPMRGAASTTNAATSAGTPSAAPASAATTGAVRASVSSGAAPPHTATVGVGACTFGVESLVCARDDEVTLHVANNSGVPVHAVVRFPNESREQWIALTIGGSVDVRRSQRGPVSFYYYWGSTGRLDEVADLGVPFDGAFLIRKIPTVDHPAFDIVMPVGTPLTAIVDGVIVTSKGDSNEGGTDATFADKANMVTLESDDGLVIEYVHLQKDGALRAVGERVHRGDVIARSGNTGFTYEPHLHLAILRPDDDNGTDYHLVRARLGGTFPGVDGVLASR